jgi:L-ribulose-5-phosphate 3-epimerase
MNASMTRRHFLAASAAAGVGLSIAGRLTGAPLTSTLHKALIGTPSEQTLEQWKAAGIEGVERTDWEAPPPKATDIRKHVESHGLKIHSVLFGWANLNEGDKAMAEGVGRMETALRTAKLYGAETVLFVPCRINVTPIPEPWEFDIRFDEQTGHLTQVVAGDNSKYQKYIEAHDHAVDTSRKGIRKLIPVAEKTGVVIALENVWNNLWVQPGIFANFVASFDTPWVRAYFDIGNHVKYGLPQTWIRTLGKLLVKCHAKDFKLNPDGHGGKFCDIREGSVDWPAVRSALDDVGYNGWLTVEGGRLSPQESSKRLDLILAGK